jgi:hypothetical protein
MPLPEPGEDPPDLRAVPLGGGFGGKEGGDHVIFGRGPQQAHSSVCGGRGTPVDVGYRSAGPWSLLVLVLAHHDGCEGEHDKR